MIWFKPYITICKGAYTSKMVSSLVYYYSICFYLFQLSRHYSGEVPIVVDKSKAKYFNGTWYMDTSQDRAKYGLIDKSRYSEVSTYISGMSAAYTKFTSILMFMTRTF